MRVLFASTWRQHVGWNHHIFSAIARSFRERKDVSVIVAKDYEVSRVAAEGQFDLLLIFGSTVREDFDFATPTALCRKSGAKCAIWLTDDPYEFDVKYRFQKYFDYIFTNDRGCVEYYYADNVHHLPLAASLEEDYEQVISPSSKSEALVFCGAAYENRKIVINDLVKEIPKSDLLLIGSGWNVEGVHCLGDVRNRLDLMRAYKCSQFVLNIGRLDSIANKYNRLTPTTPGPRTFEIALWGVPQIYFADSLEIEEYYSSEEMIIVTDIREIPAYLRRAAKEPEWRNSLAVAAQKKTLAAHCYSHRVDKLLSVVTSSR